MKPVTAKDFDFSGCTDGCTDGWTDGKKGGGYYGQGVNPLPARVLIQKFMPLLVLPAMSESYTIRYVSYCKIFLTIHTS